MKKILLLNVWDKNRGDEALTRSAVTVIQKTHPGARVDIVPLFARPLGFDVSSMTELPDRYGVTYGSRILNGVWDLFSKMNALPFLRGKVRGRAVVIGFLASVFEWLGYPHLRYFRQYDLVMLAPQGQIMSSGHPYMPIALHMLNAANRMGVLYGIVGVSVGPFDGLSKKQSSQMLNVFRGARLILLREEISKGKLAEAYPAIQPVDTSVDIVFTLTNAGIRDELSESACEYIESVVRGRIGSCISLSRTNETESLSRDEFLAIYVPKMVDFYDSIVERSDHDLVLFTHIDHDFPVLEMIKDRMKYRNRVVLFEHGYDDRGHRYAISLLEFYVSTRYHPTIFSILAGVPFISVIQHFKVRGALEAIGLSDNHCFQDDSLEDYLAVFERNWNSRDELRQRVVCARKNAHDIAAKYEDAFSELLK